MGIPRLLPAVRSISRPRHIMDYKGSVVGIDGHVWLHRSVFMDAETLANGFDTTSHVKYFIRRIQKLVASGVRPLVVFDGADLPAKCTTHKNRSSSRTISMGRAVALRESGSTSESYNLFAKAADLKFHLVRDIMTALQQEGIEAVMAPYEADAQLAHLSKLGMVDLVMTEDSDLLAYGCTRTLFKWDPVSMFGLEVLGSLSDAAPFRGLSQLDALSACILAGSDYGPGIRGIGISRAIDLVRKCSRGDGHETAFEEMMEIGRLGKFAIPDMNECLENLRIAKFVFRHQTIFSNTDCRLLPLNPYKENLEISKYSGYLGRIYDAADAHDVYKGRLHPVTHSEYQEIKKPQLGNIVLNS